MFDRHLDRRPAGSTGLGSGQESTGVLWSDLLTSKDAGLREGSRAVGGAPEGWGRAPLASGLMTFRCLGCDVSVHPLPVILGTPPPPQGQLARGHFHFSPTLLALSTS